jgi:hypothetical protein
VRAITDLAGSGAYNYSRSVKNGGMSYARRSAVTKASMGSAWSKSPVGLQEVGRQAATKRITHERPLGPATVFMPLDGPLGHDRYLEAQKNFVDKLLQYCV